MPKGPRGEKRPADVIGMSVKVVTETLPYPLRQRRDSSERLTVSSGAG